MTPRQGWVMGGTTLLAIALTWGWLRPIPAEVRAANKQGATWALPKQGDLERSSAAQFAATAALKWVGDGAKGGDGSGESQWTLLGLVRGPDLAVLVRSGSDPLIKRVKAGDTLPDGSRLAEIYPDAVVVDKDGCRIRRSLYERSQDTPAEGCGTVPDQ